MLPFVNIIRQDMAICITYYKHVTYSFIIFIFVLSSLFINKIKLFK